MGEALPVPGNQSGACGRKTELGCLRGIDWIYTLENLDDKADAGVRVKEDLLRVRYLTDIPGRS
jgi:hypothetical protein